MLFGKDCLELKSISCVLHYSVLGEHSIVLISARLLEEFQDWVRCSWCESIHSSRPGLMIHQLPHPLQMGHCIDMLLSINIA